MNTKPTLQTGKSAVQKAKPGGKSVSRMISDFIKSIDSNKKPVKKLPSVTSKLAGILKENMYLKRGARPTLSRSVFEGYN